MKMNVNSSLCKDGMVLTGEDLERYSKRRGLCHICARVQTHKRVGKLLKRNQWEPVTLVNEDTGGYQIYKGYCIQPTCYTLEQAKELLGERSSLSLRSSLRENGSLSESFSTKASTICSSLKKPPPSTSRLHSEGSACSGNGTRRPSAASRQISDASNMGTRRPSLSVTWERQPSQMSRLSVNSYVVSPIRGDCQRRALVESLDCAWKRETQQYSGNVSPTGSTTSLGVASAMGETVTSRRSTRSVRSKASHKWSREFPDIKIPFPITPEPATEEDKNVSEPKVGSSQTNSGIFKISEHARNEQSASSEKKSTWKNLFGSQQKRNMSHKDSNHKNFEKEVLPMKSNNDEVSDYSSTTSYTDTSLEEILESDDTAELESDNNMPSPPGFRLISPAVEERYRSALGALDLATKEVSGEVQAVCLQSKQLDYLDIEMLAVQKSDENQCHWLGHEFLLDESDHSNFGAEHQILFDFEGTPLVRLSQNFSNDMEELELEANMDQYDSFQSMECQESGLVEQESLVFDTRAELETAILACQDAMKLAEISDNPEDIQNGIESKQRLVRLERLRSIYLPKEDIKKKIKKISKALAKTKTKDLEKRLELARQKAELVDQLNAETTAEKIFCSEQNIGECSPKVKSDDSVGQSIPLGRSISVSCDFGNGSRSEISDLDTSFPNQSLITSRPAIEVSMTMFQSAPLAYVDPDTGTHHVCPLLDFDYEARALRESLKDAENVGANINLQLDIANTDRLSAFLARSDSRVMHISCHGHPNFLALENGFGGMQVLPVKDLKRFIAAGTGSLEVVFVSACYSLAAGNAFLQAGIRHVVCCRQDEKFRDEGAIEFARNFYRALALNNSLKTAFKMAREAMRISPMVKDSQAESDKFILLPEKPNDDPYHDVYVFSQSPGTTASTSSPPEEQSKSATVFQRKRILPRVPSFFVGREEDMYTILECLRHNDTVSIRGRPQIGKSSLVAATVRYIESRQKAYLFDDIIWLPTQEKSLATDDSFCIDLARMISLMTQSTESPCYHGTAYTICWGRILRHFQDDRRVLLVIHGRDFASESSLLSLDYFLSELQRAANVKVILVGFDEEYVFDGQCVDIEPLELEPTAILFARFNQSVAVPSHDIVSLVKKLANDTAAWRRAKFYEKVGAGFPLEIRAVAMDMTNDQLSELLRLAKRPPIAIDSRAQLEEEIEIKSAEESRELTNKNFLLARDIQETIEELEGLRQYYPTLDELHEEEQVLNNSLESAIGLKHYEEANNIQKQSAKLQKKISNEIQWNEMTALRRLPSF